MHEDCVAREKDIAAAWARAEDEVKALKNKLDKERKDLAAANLQVGEWKKRYSDMLTTADDLHRKNHGYRYALQAIAALPPSGDGGMMQAQSIADEAVAEKPKRACPKCGFWNCEESCQAPGKYAEKRKCAKCGDSGTIPAGLGIVRCECTENRKDHS